MIIIIICKKVLKDNSFKTKIFIIDQLKLLNKDENYRNIDVIFIHSQTAFHLALLDKLFKLTSLQSNDSTPFSFLIDNISLTGFAEYLVWQQQNNVHGFIISDLKNSFPMSSSIQYKPSTDLIHSKVHLLCSDLSILPINQKINQRYLEKYNKRQMLISCRNALTKLHENGHFICKLTDTLTRFTTGLIYLLYYSFKSICILRPFTLDPSSSQRFLVCYQLKSSVNQRIIDHLDHLLKYEKTEDILEVVPLKCLLDSEFQQYIADTSQRLIQREIQALSKRLWLIEHIDDDDEEIDLRISDDDWKEAHDCVSVERRSSSSSDEPDSGIQLPFGWIKRWSKREERFYYFGTSSVQSRWEPSN
ncbi:hypothetical protein I4U23_010487 [Adineta vaga]|nr:hypothetical protein I4U23_010487 [Adineta vaga]